jgi:hypothetical protein
MSTRCVYYIRHGHVIASCTLTLVAQNLNRPGYQVQDR